MELSENKYRIIRNQKNILLIVSIVLASAVLYLTFLNYCKNQLSSYERPYAVAKAGTGLDLPCKMELIGFEEQNES
jgi:hypothetical protein